MLIIRIATSTKRNRKESFKKGFTISFQWKVIVNLILVIAFFLTGITMTAQSTKKSKSTDWIGPLGGANVVLFYPKDVNKNLINGGDPQILPAGMFGLGYYHSFTPRWAHLFQLRLSNHQIKYWKATEKARHSMGGQVTLSSDSGDYHIKYKIVSMSYRFGWCVNKQLGWHFYSGLLVNHVVDNQSTKLVDRTVFGSYKSNTYTPYPQPITYEDELSVTYAPNGNLEILFRTDFRIGLGDQWMIRPVVEYGIDPSRVQVSVKDQLAFYLEVYKQL